VYQNIFVERIKEEKKEIIHLWDDITGYTCFDFERYAYKKSEYGDRKTLFGENVNIVKQWSKYDLDNGLIYESDISPETRTLVDLYYESDSISVNHRIIYFDIEVEVTEGIPNSKLAENTITAISLYCDSINEYYVYILDDNVKHIRNKNEEIVPFSTEEDLLLAFLSKWREMNATIITGWNIDNFDVPYLYNRIKNVLGEDYANKLSPIDIVHYNDTRNRFFIAGISSMDYLSLYKNYTYTALPSYNLDAVSREELNEGKISYEGNLNDLKINNIDKFIEYSLHDTRLIVKLNQKLNFITLAQGICHKGHVPYEDIYYSSRWIEGAMLAFMKKKGIVSPNKKQENKELMEDRDSFSGAYVKSPESDLYHWLYDLDFTSLYPSIIMSLNISPETKIGKLENWDAEQYIKNEDVVYTGYLGKDKIQINKAELQHILNHYKFAISSNGVMYNMETRGMVPLILDEWFKEKDNFDSLMKQYGNVGDKEKSQYYKQRRTITKVMLNSVYGVLGLPIFRFYDIDNAAAVTTTGVTLIKYTEKMGNWYYNNILKTNTDYCIYMDTDSVFFQAIPLVKHFYTIDETDSQKIAEDVLKITSKVQSFLNNSFKLFSQKFLNIEQHRFNIKQEVIARSGIWTAKKRYALWIINEDGIAKDKIIPKGLDIVRSSFPTLFKGFLKEILSDILKGVSKEIIDNKILQFRKQSKTSPIEKISIPTSVKNIIKYGTKPDSKSKTFQNWSKGAPAHVKAAIAYNEFINFYNLQKKYAPIYDGEKIKWVYLKQNQYGLEGIAFKGYDDPPQIMEFISMYIDRLKIFDRVLLNKLEDFYSAMKWGIPPLQQNKFF